MGEMGRNGHHVSVINPIASSCPNPSNICEYQEGLLEASDLANAESAWVADWSVFRAAPGVLKRKVFEDGLGTVSRLQGGKALRGLEQRIFHGNSVLERMTEFLSSESSVPTVKLIHLFNTHPPFMLDSECNFIGVKKRIYRHDQTEQTACVMKWTLELFDRMKEQGVYDNTMILLTADTGMGNFYAEDDLSSLYAKEHGIPEGEKGRLIGGANPVLAIKWPETRGRLQRSPTQAQLTDIPMTICAALTGCDWSVGLDLKQAQIDMRTRVYDYYRWENRFWGLTEIPGITRYEVKGPLWLDESWTAVASSEEQ